MLKILSHTSDSYTGHITVNLQVVERPTPNSEVLGTPETHGISASKLQEQYGGDVTKWLARKHGEMCQRHESRKIARTAMDALTGVTLFDEDIINGNHVAPAGTEVQRHADEDSARQPAE